MQPINLFEYESLASEQLPSMVYGYYASGANDEVTLKDNRSAYDRIRLRPRMMRGVRHRDHRVRVLDREISAPLLIAPMAFMKMAHPDGELAVVRASGKRGLPMILSTMSNTTLEDVMQETSAPKWFQLYVYKDRRVTERIVERATHAGYEALVLTVDVPVLGRREADIRNGFHLPPDFPAANLVTAEMQSVRPANQDSGLAAYAKDLQEDNLVMADITWLKTLTGIPIIVKGIMRGDDAQMAIEHGADGIIVSNHGGRQLDTAPATIDVLSEVVQAVNGRVDVLVDGGIRRGTDIVKALALGAKAVLLGRPVLWGLTVDGEDGVGHVLDLLLAEFDNAMAQCGCRNPSEITPDLLWRA